MVPPMARPQIDMTALLADPLGTMKAARREGWLADGMPGTLAVLTHERVRELLGDPRLRANFADFLHFAGISSGPFYDWMAVSPLNHDGEYHQRWRALMGRTFTPRRVEGLRPFLRTAAHELIDRFAARGRCEFVAEFADEYPSLGLCELIGVPTADRDRFRGWANTVGLGFNLMELPAKIAVIDDALAQLLAYTGALAAERRANPRDDLVTRIAQAAGEDGWNDQQVASFIGGLVFAGHETTKNQLGWMVALLAERADLWDAVASGTLPAAEVVEEVLRHRSAATAVGRAANETVEHGGERIEQGTRLLLSLWSANHDEAAYPRGDELAPAENREVPHLAFGHGAHHCLGAALARAELQEALGALAGRLECPRVAEGAVWKPLVGINGPEELPIVFRARGG